MPPGWALQGYRSRTRQPIAPTQTLQAEEVVALEKWKSGGLMPFFVKNLENVQGDERDVIFISTTYGRNREGVVAQRFGPINQADGWRRLNVLFTRARKRIELFTSLQPGDVIVDAQSSRGVRPSTIILRTFGTGSSPDRGPGIVRRTATLRWRLQMSSGTRATRWSRSSG